MASDHEAGGCWLPAQIQGYTRREQRSAVSDVLARVTAVVNSNGKLVVGMPAFGDESVFHLLRTLHRLRGHIQVN